MSVPPRCFRSVFASALTATFSVAASAQATPTDQDQVENPPISLLLEEEFREDTETREQQTGRRYLTERAEQVLSDFVDIGGYLRSGYGRTGEGGPMVGFQAPGAVSKYRLGNEAETYGELIVGKNFYLPGTFDLDGTEPMGAPLKEVLGG